MHAKNPPLTLNTIAKLAIISLLWFCLGLSRVLAQDIEVPAADSSNDLVIEVDQKHSQNEHKSLPLALLYSALLPGSGEFYLAEKGNAKIFLLAEAGFWAGLYISFLAQDSYLQSARNYASEFSGIDASVKNEAFLNTMSNYRAYQEKQHRQDSYELSQILSGKRDRDYEIPMKPENDWDFGSSTNPQNTQHWKSFQSTLRYYRASKVAVSFAFGALALNRLASLANTLHVYKGTSARGLGMELLPEFGPDYTGARLTLGF
jgi:TM2 domain-containing membrane protein YozV